MPIFLCRLVVFLAVALLCAPVSRASQAGSVPSFDVSAAAHLRVGERVVFSDVPLPGGGAVSLELERFSVITGRTRLVVGGSERPLDFDPSSVVLLRGGVVGDPHGHVFLTEFAGAVRGRIELGSGERLAVTSRGSVGGLLPAGRAIVVPDGGGAGGGGLPGCGVRGLDGVEPAPSAGEGPAVVGGPLYQVEVAVETDYELFEQFGDLRSKAAYILQLYGAISDIYIRDVGTSVRLSYVRLWDTPDDLFNEYDPLSIFRNYWENNMQHVHRDVAQLVSGRVNFWYGGVAYLSGVCQSAGYSVNGYILGGFGSDREPTVFNRDITVVAHELGHNLGARHTQDYNIDVCHRPEEAAQRGTIMSYCGQTHTGGNANMDMRFHRVPAREMRRLMAQRGCIAADCNLNGTADADDIASGFSRDENGNGVPDECEDCNGNGVLDPEDIAGGGSADVNGNGVPDECEPDCNGNGLPDSWDIAEGVSTDAYGDGVPDECETDCDGDGTSDYTQICLDMHLDLDRDARLDACEDCDGDGVTDLAQLDGVNNVWVADKEQGALREFLSVTGTVVRDSDDAALVEPADVRALTDGRVLVSSGEGRIVEFDHRGVYLRDLAPAGAGGLSEPGALLPLPDGRLLVASGGTDSVKAYEIGSGAYLGDVVAPGAGGLLAPFGLAASGEALLVTSDDGRVLAYDLRTGAFERELVRADDNGGLVRPRGLLVMPEGRLLVVSYGTDRVLEFDLATGEFLRRFNRGGTDDRMTLDQPWCIRRGPAGGVFVSRAHDHDHFRERDELHLTNARIFHFHPETGKLVRAYVQAIDSGIEHPTGFDFVPVGGSDCNLNLVPDACDIASGVSDDDNGDGVPDECESRCPADHDGNGVADSRDVVAFFNDWIAEQSEADANGDGIVDTRDVVAFLALWGAGC